MRTILKTGLAALGAAALLTPALADEGDNRQNGGAKIVASLTGSAVVGSQGIANGAGLFEARINPGTERICYDLEAGNIDDSFSAHIHEGAAGANGGMVLTLDTPDDGDDDSEECQDIDRGLATSILRNPENYYVDIHTEGFADGALRGQLKR